MTFNQRKAIGVTLIMVGILTAGFIIFRSAFYAPETYLNPPVEYIATETLYATTTSSAPTPPPAPKPAPVVPTKLPDRLQIPSLSIDAHVQHVGLKPNGAMANPNNFKDVGWYKPGTVPGEVGSAAIAGHVDNALALSGVFKRLVEIKVGDDVYVLRADGKKLRFRVDAVEYYPYTEAPNARIFTSSDGKAHLNLITCAGTWLKDVKSYTERLVVYTTLVE